MRFRFPLRFLFGALLLAVSAGTGAASILVLGNGDRLTGKVIKREGGKVYFHTEVLGDVVAAEKDVSIVEGPPSPTPVQSLTGLPPAGASPAVAAASPAKLKPVKPVRTNWTGKVELGYDNQLTNIRTVNTVTRVQVDRTVGPDDFMAKGRYLYGKSAGLPTTDLSDGEFRVRHNLNTNLFVQSDTTGGFNHIQLINFEGQENLGAGLKVLPTVRQTIDVGAGVSGQYLRASGIQTGWDYLGNVFQDYAYKLNGRYTLTEDLSAQYSPQRRGRFVVTSDTAAPLRTGSEQDYAYKFHSSLQGQLSRHLSLNLHYEYEYNNAVLDPKERADQRITTTLGYGF